MIYITTICSEIADNINYQKIINEIECNTKDNDKVIVITSAPTIVLEQLVIDMLKQNIDDKDQIELLALKEQETACHFYINLKRQNIPSVILYPHQIPIIASTNEIEYVELMNILSKLVNHKYVIIPGNFGITKYLNNMFYGSNQTYKLGVYIYDKIKSKKLKVQLHIYTKADGIMLYDEFNNITKTKLDQIKKDEIRNIRSTLDQVLDSKTLDKVINKQIELSIGNKFLDGTKIIT